MKRSIIKTISDYRVILLIYSLMALTACLQGILSGKKALIEGGREYTFYNVYVIFENSFHHLVEHKDLYIHYPEEQWDLYKYSPTFAAFFGVFAVLPDWAGLLLWDLLNALFFLGAIYYLPKLNAYQKGLILILCTFELMTSMQNEQSNGLMAGLIILAFGLLERNKYAWATLCLVFSVYIKLFGLVGFALCLFYPHKLKLAGYSALWFILLLAVPLIFIDAAQYKFLFASWGNMLAHDQASSYGYSVMGWLHAWFGITEYKLLVVLIGVLLFLIPLVRLKQYENYTFRFLTLGSVLIWIVLFNHKAESPTFIIAMAGIALWFVTSEKNALNITFFVTAFILTSLSPTDLFPKFIRNDYVKPYMLKVFPCILIWLKMLYDMIVMKRDTIEEKPDPVPIN